MVEPFNKSLKTERVDKKHPFVTREIVRKAIFEYIEMFYNPM
ncbi:MAG: IS3 family transposase [Clostridia bacterium]|nr:IS3 family transposase [Clostridia bacterium]